LEREIVANAFHHVYWGVPIAVYYWLAGISEGLFLIASLGWAFGIKRFKPLSFATSTVAFILIAVVQVFLVFDLGKVERALHLFPGVTGYWHESAPLAWGSLLVATYSVGTLLYSFFVFRKNERLAKIVGLVTFVLAGALCWYTGVTLELNPSRHPNHTGMAPLLFFVGANLSGLGAACIFIWLREFIGKADKELDPQVLVFLGQMLLIGIVFDLFLIFSEFLQMTYGTAEEYHTLEVIRSVFKGPVPMFYVGMGLILPLIIFMTPFGKRRGGIALASALVIAGLFGMRVGWVLVGQFSQSFF
jgi:formate-dependent nitrite reductase membrane component NrfD